MVQEKRGFTLIELLVVILIIGILATVALPQYQLAVNKARVTQAISVSASLKEAQEIYYLANGKYSTQFSELDIDVPVPNSIADKGTDGWRGQQAVYDTFYIDLLSSGESLIVAWVYMTDSSILGYARKLDHSPTTSWCTPSLYIRTSGNLGEQQTMAYKVAQNLGAVKQPRRDNVRDYYCLSK